MTKVNEGPTYVFITSTCHVCNFQAADKRNLRNHYNVIHRKLIHMNLFFCLYHSLIAFIVDIEFITSKRGKRAVKPE